MRISRYLFSIAIPLIISGCGYRMGYGELTQVYHTIDVPYVIGDRNGDLTNEIIKTFSTSGAFDYQRSGADLILYAVITDLSDENIGFRYDRKKKGKLTDVIIPAETRIYETVEVKVLNRAGDCVLGPVLITADVDFDHEYYGSPNGINIFSLGQLSDIDTANEAVFTPLNRVLARKIVDFVNNSW